MVRHGLLAVGAMLAATSARAQYAPYPPQPGPYLAYGEVPPDDRVFTGPRVEAHVAYDRLKPDLDDDAVFAARNRDGLGYGGELGFDLPVAGVVLGGYVGADGSTIRECTAVAGGSLCLRLGRSLFAGARVGVPLGASALLYAKGGYTNGRLLADYVSPAAGTGFALRQNLNGYHVGAGVEAALSARTYGKLEYVYTRLRGLRRDPGDDGTDFDRQQVQAGFGVRF